MKHLLSTVFFFADEFQEDQAVVFQVLLRVRARSIDKRIIIDRYDTCRFFLLILSSRFFEVTTGRKAFRSQTERRLYEYT